MPASVFHWREDILYIGRQLRIYSEIKSFQILFHLGGAAHADKSRRDVRIIQAEAKRECRHINSTRLAELCDLSRSFLHALGRGVPHWRTRRREHSHMQRRG